MIESRVASRYAKSMLNLANEQGSLIEAFDEMKLISDTFESSRELQLLLNSPIIKVDKKVAVFNAIFKDKLSDLTLNFVSIIIKKRREGHLYDITRSFQTQFRHQNNIVIAEVTSANGLDDKMRSTVLKLVQESLKSEVELIEKQNPDLIGGMVLRIGDQQYDGSLLRSLNDLKKEFDIKQYKAN